MKIARVPSKKRNIVTLLILIIGLPIVVYASYQVIQLISNASADTQPKNVLISNLTTSSATITWTTDGQTRGSVTVVKNGVEQSPVIDKRGNNKRYTHYTELTSLEPNSSYNFIITSETTKYTAADNKKFTFKTAPISAETPTPNPIHGSVEGISSDDVLIFAVPKDKSAYPVSATMPSGGNWIMDLSTFRKVSDYSLILTSDTTNIVVIAVTGTDTGAVVTGAYSELFDSNGKLNSTQTLTIGDNASLYTNFPTVAMLEAYEAPTEEEKNDEETTTTPTVPDTSTEQEDNTETTTDGRVYRLVKDIDWVDMITTSTSTWSYGADTIQITNLTDTGFTVIWVSKSAEQGYVKYGTSSTDLSSQAYDERDGVTNKGSYYVHSVSLTRLQPSTEYYFEVISGSTTYNNGGKEYNTETFATLNSPPAYVSITGTVSNLPDSKEGVVIGYIKDMDSTGSSGQAGKISALLDDNGKWILSIADSRTSDGSAYFEYTSLDSMYFDVLSTTKASSTTSISMNGITGKDISITLENSTSTSTVEKLQNYGVI